MLFDGKAPFPWKRIVPSRLPLKPAGMRFHTKPWELLTSQEYRSKWDDATCFNFKNGPSMKNWILLALVLAGLAAVILLVWVEDTPWAGSANPGSAEEQSQFEPETPRLPFGPGGRDAASKPLAKSPDSAAEQTNNPSQTDMSASKPLKSTRANRTAPDFPDYEEAEEFVIGGLVQDEDGNPLPHIAVLAERIDDPEADPLVDDPMVEDVPSTLSDFDGTFLFDKLEDGEYRVSIAHIDGIAPVQTTVRAGTLNLTLVVVVLWDFRIYGTVSSTDGEPIEDVHIITGPSNHITGTGSRGEYELDIILQGKNVVHIIYFQHKDFRQQQFRISQADLGDLTRDFELNVSMEPLKRLTTVTGSLTDTEGSPVGGEVLFILTSQMQTKYQTQSDMIGNFFFEKVEPGKDYRLAIRPGSGYKNKDINPLVVPDSGLNLDIVLEPSERGELSGWMIDLDSNPIPGFSLTLHSAIATGQSVSVVGDQQGYFSVEDFPVGGALFRTNSYPVLTVRGLHVSPEPEEPVTIILDIGSHVLQGQVINEFGEPVAAADITLDWEFRISGLLNSSSRKTTADQNGNFIFTGLGSGLHIMQVSAAGFSIVALAINIGIDPNEILVELEEEAN